MYASLISIVLFGLLILSSIVLLIVGVAKKKKGIQAASVVLFLIGVAGGAFSVFSYMTRVVQYVKSPAFQQDARKGTALIGETLGSAVSGTSEGIEKTLDEEAIRKMAGKSANIVGKSTKTIAASLDSTLWSKSVFMDKSLHESGIKSGSSTERDSSLAINLDFSKDFKGRLRLTKYDLEGKIIESVEAQAEGNSGDNKIVTFKFLQSSSELNSYYIVSRKD